MSNSVGGNQQTAGAVAFGGHNNAAPAQFTVGEIGFGPCWEEEPSLRELYDKACASIVRAECEADELRAEVALLREEQAILKAKLEAAANG